MRTRRTRRFCIAALLASTALIAASCGDDDDDGAGGGEPAAPAPTGAPIEIGFSNNENSPAGSYPAMRRGAEAAVEYINKELGGVNGRPLDMETCISNASGESSIACANRFVQGDKVAVTYGLDFGGAGGMPVYTDAGIPVFGGEASEPAQVTAPNAFVFVGSISSTFPALARYIAEDIKPRKVAVLTNDLPAAVPAVDTFTKPVLASYGITDVTVVAESATAADFTPALSKANEGDPGAILVIFGGPACAKIMQSTTTLGIPTDRMFYILNCTAKDAVEAGGPGADGIRANSPYLAPNSDDPEVQIYRDALQKYAADTEIGVDSQLGFSEIMNFYNIAKTIQGDITKESVTAAFKATDEQPNFMAYPYTCDGQQAPGLAAICNVHERIVQYRNGEFGDVKNTWVEGVSRLGG